MTELVDRPVLMLVVSFVGLLLAAMLGVVAHKAWIPSRPATTMSSPSSSRPR